MEMYFTYNNNNVLNFNDVIRKEVTKIYEEEQLMTNNINQVMDDIGSKLLNMYEESKLSFDFYIQTMLSSTYMMFINKMKNNTLDEEDLISLNIIKYTVSDSSKFKDYISSKAGIFEDMVKYTVLFEKLSILGRKAVVQDSEEYKKEITQISPLATLDFLRYSPPIKVEEFINYYIETLDLVVSDPSVIVNDIKYHMKHLYMHDKDAYLKNLKKMAKVFYKWTKYQKNMDEIENEEEIYCLNIIEKSDEQSFCELSILDDRLLFNVIYGYCYYSTNNGIRIKNEYIQEEYIDEYIKDKIPEVLKEASPKIKK